MRSTGETTQAQAFLAVDGMGQHVLSGQYFRFDLTFFKRFLNLLRILFPSCRHVITLLFVFLLSISLLEQYVIYNLGLVPSKYYKVLGEKDKSGFTKHTVTAILLILAEAFLKSTKTYVTNILYINWRSCLSKHLHSKYFRDDLYYQVNVIQKKIDNPDQRMTQDVDKMCNAFSQIITPLIISPFTIAYYIHQAVVTTGFIGPVSVLGFFIVATVINKFLMSPVVHFFYRQERMEGDFRFKHMLMRTNAESAAFYRAGLLEEEKTNERLQALINTQHSLMRREYALDFSINCSDYLGSILSYVALAFPIFAGSYDDLSPADLSQLISKNAFVCIYLISCFTKLIDLASLSTDVAGTAHRIGELLEHLGTLRDEHSASYNFLVRGDSDKSRKAGVDNVLPETLTDREVLLINQDDNACNSALSDFASGKMAVSLVDVTYGPPKSKEIFCRDLGLEFKSGTNVLITGDSGCGKSSLLRVINGLWSSLTGSVCRHISLGPSGILFLPQKPYFTDGSLRQQIIYPMKCTKAKKGDQADQVIMEYLTYVGLSGLLDRLGGLDTVVNWNWYDELSPGEMQRLSFVRLFYHQPKFAVLDEATSQIGLQAEAQMYKRLSDFCITVLSVGHRDSLRQYHHVGLHLNEDGSWNIRHLDDPTRPNDTTHL